MKAALFIFIFSSFAAADCRENVVAKCGSMQILHKVCGNASGSFKTDKFTMIDEDGERVGFVLKDGQFRSLLWQSKKNVSYGLNVLTKMDGNSEYSLQPIGVKAQPVGCESLSLKNDPQTQTAHQPADDSSAAR